MITVNTLEYNIFYFTKNTDHMNHNRGFYIYLCVYEQKRGHFIKLYPASVQLLTVLNKNKIVQIDNNNNNNMFQWFYGCNHNISQFELTVVMTTWWDSTIKPVETLKTNKSTYREKLN